MKHSQNVIYDFCNNTIIDNQPVAVMPATLARKLLEMLAKQLKGASFYTIKNEYLQDLTKSPTMEELVARSLAFVQERELVENVSQGKWDAYAVLPERDEEAKEDKVAPEAVAEEIVDERVVAEPIIPRKYTNERC